MSDDATLRGFPLQPVITDFERALVRRYVFALLGIALVWFAAGVLMTYAVFLKVSLSLPLVTLATAAMVSVAILMWVFRVPARPALIPVPVKVNSSNCPMPMDHTPDSVVADSDVINLLDRRVYKPKHKKLP